MNDVQLYFEFEDEEGKLHPLQFSDPINIITAHHVNEVNDAFSLVEQALAEGCYVAGCVSYEAAPAFDSSYKVNKSSTWPLVWFGVFEKPLSQRLDHEILPYESSEWRMDGSFQEYKNGLNQIKDAIQKGDTYQVNYTTRLTSKFKGNTFSFYKQLTNNQKSGYSAYLNLGSNREILSASPELFFRKNGTRLKTKPMKGTARRGRTLEEDKVQKETLRKAEKEKAENLMIVDLLRNDIGKLAVSGTVKVPNLFDVETYPTVHQMTSTIEAIIEEKTTLHEIFQALFPCGSITGAPKVRTMSYIAELESSARDFYCGAIGYMTPTADAVFNVPIRTVLLDQDQAVYGTGGGVTWDSTPVGEYEEVLTKAQLLMEKRPDFQLLESMKLEDGNFPLLSYHLIRLENSTEYFQYQYNKEKVEDQIETLKHSYPRGLYKVRLLLHENGTLNAETQEIDKSPESVFCSVAKESIDENNPFLFHKTTYRSMYETHNRRNVYAVLLWNSREELTEFTIANLVVKYQGHYFTPPVESGLLRGTYREKLLNNGKIKEKTLYKKNLDSFEEIWMINGVRGWVRVYLT
ncbi:aminodeoxychorismate synthase component I [Halobacillus seohaensis]|uniref:Aminodeoxychorismate synthase component I n=1 Tax=Halobacillus seohaensis TaxID=447421 RepID=A0ABW2EIR5_9BACI